MSKTKTGQTVRAIRFRGEDEFHICVRDNENRPICGHVPKRWIVSNATSDVYIDNMVATITIENGIVCDGCVKEANNMYGIIVDRDAFTAMLPMQLWYIEVEGNQGPRSFVVKAHTKEDAIDKLSNGGVKFDSTMHEDALENCVEEMMNKDGWVEIDW